ncbi:hypothetical protein [Plasticicumulans lactativorans]|uniref:hypothetical protein n=1 Tax=Plasticicumulans lactativorans TaxID=1133106 RepID=UPI00104D29F5|nr:hypothetical protein [Plasticicumulans lactativorans]
MVVEQLRLLKGAKGFNTGSRHRPRTFSLAGVVWVRAPRHGNRGTGNEKPASDGGLLAYSKGVEALCGSVRGRYVPVHWIMAMGCGYLIGNAAAACLQVGHQVHRVAAAVRHGADSHTPLKLSAKEPPVGAHDPRSAGRSTAHALGRTKRAKPHRPAWHTDRQHHDGHRHRSTRQQQQEGHRRGALGGAVVPDHAPPRRKPQPHEGITPSQLGARRR